MTAVGGDRSVSLVLDPEEARRLRSERIERIGTWLLPLAIMIVAIWLWDRICVWNEIPRYILPRPAEVLQTLVSDWPLLFSSLLVTLKITFLSLVLAVLGGVGLAVLFAQSKWVEMSFFPFAIVLQVTPIVAIFPLINIYVDNQTAKLLLCSWIVAFFPILSNTTLGLNSVDRNLIDLFRLNGASRFQELFHASRIIESGYRLNAPRLFAALILVSFTGIVIFLVLSLVSHLVLRRWHESALKQER
jgi:NitT/TauT family transport system permease protein